VNIFYFYKNSDRLNSELSIDNITLFTKGGPCTEIHYDRNYDLNLNVPGADLVNKGTERVIELWNIGKHFRITFLRFN
jgi:hypothetical protein